MQPLNALDDPGGRGRALGDGVAVHEAAYCQTYSWQVFYCQKVLLELTCQWEYPIKSSLQTQRVVLTVKQILGRYSIVRKYSTVRIQLVHELTVCQAVSKVLQPGVGGIQDPFTHLSRAFLLVPIMRAQMTELSEQSSVCINIILQPRISKWITRISNYYWRSQFSTNQE